ncbi:MAG: creatininase family protein [Planctomycetaceae bacterium]|nr:creatininase family protein [Planctomycetaceae bacterium]
MSRFAISLLLPGLFAGMLVALPDPIRPDPASPRPIDAVDSVFIEDLTWMEVRDALKSGHDTVVVATGGVEQNGPYLVTGKHNVVLRGTTEAIARKLGKTLVAPIVPFVPEGDIEPPSQHMLYPGTISVSEATYEALLADICASLKAHGFRRIVLIGDSGGNQTGLKAVADRLGKQWEGKCGVLYIPEYYDFSAVTKWLESQGIKQTPEGLHDDFGMTAQLLAVEPQAARMNERIKAGKFKINGVDLPPAEKSIEWGRRIIDLRADITVKAIQKASQP